VEGGLLNDVGTWPANFRSLASDGTSCTLEAAADGACTIAALQSLNPIEQFSPFRQGSRQQYSLSASGGGEQTTFYTSGTFQREKGVFASNDLRSVNLRDGSAPHWLVAKALKYLGNRPAQLLGDDFSCLCGGKRRHLCLQLAELHIVLVRDKVASRADDLSELHEGRPKLPERETHPFRHRLRQQSLLVNGNRGVLDPKKTLQCHKPQDVRKSVLPKD
jgi:hypothetical protein